jgi:ergothioneine biosynthesis protein EgtB
LSQSDNTGSSIGNKNDQEIRMPKTCGESSTSSIEHALNAYVSTRSFSDQIVAALSAEDCCIQSMDDVSPMRWHLAHTTWFFETFLLREQPGYKVFDEQFNFLFNSYYNTIGTQYPRHRRGLLSRPSLQRIKDYRVYVDEQMLTRLPNPDFTVPHWELLQIGLNHEQQHQELMLTDIKHVLACNPCHPAYSDAPIADSLSASSDPLSQHEWIKIRAGNYQIGHQGIGFAFDNELPRHTVYLHDYEISPCLVTCGEYLEFIHAGGYERPEFWLSLGWNTVCEQHWRAPLYWQETRGTWQQFTLAGMQPIVGAQPVTHLSYFEADAYARWRGLRLPTEAEWEIACEQTIRHDQTTSLAFADELFLGNHAIHPTQRHVVNLADTNQLAPFGLMGSVWQWTSSSYAAYPGYRPPVGAVGEYNGKFMCNQYILRGGSVATNSNHIRTTYRNFFPADTRWQFSGIRLAKTCGIVSENAFR